MGYEVHDAIIVTSCSEEDILTAHEKALDIFGKNMTHVTPEVVNGFRSFMIPPDGSKEGWEDSTRGEEDRQKFLEFVRTKPSLDWIYIRFGGDLTRDGGFPVVREYSK